MEMIAMMYVRLMMKKRRKYKDCDEYLKPYVKQLCIDLELEDLIEED